LRRSLLILAGLLPVAGCGDEPAHERTVIVEVASVPSGLRMSVAVGFTELVELEAETPIAQSLHVRANCSGVGPTFRGCEIVALAKVKDGDPTGTRVTTCLTEARHERVCAFGNGGRASVTLRD
jgi:hypothetical protein